jgi:hypothetical protein
MDKSELLNELAGTMVKAKVEKLADLDFSLSDLLDLTFYPKKEIAFRAAWTLEYIVQKNPERFLQIVPEFLDCYPRQTTAACCRHFAKILMYLTDTKPLKGIRLPETCDIEPLVEKTFDWLINQKSSIALRVYSMNVLFNLSQKEPWIKEELKAEITFLLHDGSAAIQSRRRAILKKIK